MDRACTARNFEESLAAVSPRRGKRLLLLGGHSTDVEPVRIAGFIEALRLPIRLRNGYSHGYGEL